MISVSKSFAARRAISRCPFVSGSKLPGYTATCFCFFSFSSPCGEATFEEDVDLDALVGPSPTPEFAAMMAEEFQRLLDCLGSDKLRQVALWKMEGYTNEQISQRLDCALRTVANKLELIRKIWEAERLS